MLKPSKVFPLALIASLVSFELLSPFPTRSLSFTLLGWFCSTVIAFLVWFAYQVWLYPIYLSPLRHLPTSDQKWWNLGIGDATPLHWERWVQTIPNNGFIRYFRPLNSEAVLIVSEEGLRYCLTNQHSIQRSFNAGLVLVLGRTNLVSSYGQQHKISRKRVQPAFNAPYIKDLYPVFWAKAVELASELTKQGPAPINTEVWFHRLTLDVISLAGFGVEYDSLRNPDGLLPRTYRNLTSKAGIIRIQIAAALFPNFRWLRYRADPKLFKASKHLRASSEALVQKRLDTIHSGRVEKSSDHKDILDFAIRDGTASMEELIDYTMTFLGAGHETTSSTLSWALYEISRRPDVQDRLRRDIRAHLPSPRSGQSITAAHIDHLPALTAFLSEVLRFHPSIPQVMRHAQEDVVIAGQHFPKGTTLILALRMANRMPQNWTAGAKPPTEFDPWRFLSSDEQQQSRPDPSSPTTAPHIEEGGGGPKPSNGGATSLYSFMTFSRGEKSCIGERFARAQMAVELAVLIGRFKMTFAGAGKPGVMRLEDAQRLFLISDKIQGGVWVCFEEVEGW